MWNFVRHTWVMVLGLCLCALAALAAPNWQGDDDSRQSSNSVPRIAASAYVSWWSHDSMGYHPSILLKLENYSGRDLTGRLIRLQARFTDLNSGIVTIGRGEARKAFVPHQQIYVMLRGPQAFDLPINEYNWPHIECKVMCRVGTAGDEGTQTLAVTRLDSITMTEDDAMEKMSRMPDLTMAAERREPVPNPNSAPAQARSHLPGEDSLTAKAGSLPPAAVNGNKGSKAGIGGGQFLSLLGKHALPGLGNDFYLFEKTFGEPSEVSVNDAGWIWALFKVNQPRLNVIVGSRGRSGKAEVMVINMSDWHLSRESDLRTLATAFAGGLKKDKPGPPAHSVRYLPSGRIHFLITSASGYRALYFKPNTLSAGNSYVIISSLPGNLVDLIAEHGRHASVLHGVARLLGG